MKSIFTLIFFFISTFVVAEEPDKAIVIRAKQMLDVSSGKLVPNPVIVVQGDKITAINPDELPAETKVVELKGMTVLPGLIDTHTHIAYDPDNLWIDIGRGPSSYAAGYAIVGAKNARLTLLAGFTTIRDLGACCNADIHVKRAIDKNLIDGPSIYPAGNIITTTGGNCEQAMVDPNITKPGPEHGIGNDIASLREAVRLQIRNGAKVIKVCADRNNFTTEELKAIADAAHQRKIKLAVHVWEQESVRKAIEAGADSIEHSGIMSDADVDAMVQKGIYLVPTMLTMDLFDLSRVPPDVKSRLEKEIPQFEETFQKALKKNAKIAFGSDTGEIPHGENAKEFTAMVKRGMPTLQAIQSATIHAADLMSLPDRGEIKTGLRADLIAVSGNPLESIHLLENPLFVMKAGKIYKQP
jgi:imidazolonepropionase-like amidohydrolase